MMLALADYLDGVNPEKYRAKWTGDMLEIRKVFAHTVLYLTPVRLWVEAGAVRVNTCVSGKGEDILIPLCSPDFLGLLVEAIEERL